ncbi:AraC family transcriptional regulator [Salininema proteolyticum]|uniref:AraC family transcriptional regulator n=1 Tax=Salininema proteolyticum TaxID=1607685 RepID=A0ABV8U4L6_9ACTN
MDPLSDFLRGIRSDGATLCRAALPPPWSIELTTPAPLRLVTVLRGEAVLVLHDGTTAPMEAGCSAIVATGKPVRIVDSLESLDGPDYDPECETWNRPREDLESMAECCPDTAVVVAGHYQASGRGHETLLKALPPLIAQKEQEGALPVLNSILDQTIAGGAGAQAVADRFLDWGLVCNLRQWFESRGDRAPGWFRGMRDEVIAPALEAVHSDVAHPWTVTGLAERAKVSRALFADRFRTVMDQTPLRYVTQIRMTRAEDLLRGTDLSVGAIAREVGYANSFAFSNAFKTARHVSPSKYRTTVTSA